jgi:hypothetical protein
MLRPLVALSLAVALAAGCASRAPNNDPLAYRPGTGVVQSMTRAPAPMTGTAAAGGSAPMYRLTIRMDDGRTQYIDTPSADFTQGTRVQLTEDRLLRKL